MIPWQKLNILVLAKNKRSLEFSLWVNKVSQVSQRFFFHWHLRLLSVWLAASLSSCFVPAHHSRNLGQTSLHAYQHQSGPAAFQIESCSESAWFAGFPPALAARLFPFVSVWIATRVGKRSALSPISLISLLLHTIVYYPLCHSIYPPSITHVIWVPYTQCTSKNAKINILVLAKNKRSLEFSLWVNKVSQVSQRFFSYWHLRLLSVWLAASLSSCFVPAPHSRNLGQTSLHAYQHQSGLAAFQIESCSESAWFAGFPPALTARLFPFVSVWIVTRVGKRSALSPISLISLLLHTIVYYPLCHSIYPPSITHVIWVPYTQ